MMACASLLAIACTLFWGWMWSGVRTMESPMLTQATLATQGREQTPAAGVVHASVAVLADPSNSYALYLPSQYSPQPIPPQSARANGGPQKRWPLLLVFDPFGRGEAGVKVFHEAAERYGFIVVGSNNSRNFQDPSSAIRLLWADVKERYAIDPRRIYTAGLSGGARVASSIALACKSCIAGVIANGAGLPNGAATPGPEVADWFLVAGTTDFNYPEMLKLKEALDANNAASRFVVYDGPHNWMPPEFAGRALAWLQLRAMAKGLTAPDQAFIDQQFSSRVAEAKEAQSGGDVLEAVRAWRGIARDFRSFRDVKGMEELARKLADSDDFRKARKNQKATLELEDEVAKKAGDLVAGIHEQPDNRSAYMAQLQSEVNEEQREQKSAKPERKNAIARGLASAFAYAAETGQQEMLKKDYASAREMFQAGEIIEPESSWASYLLATAYAQLGEKKQATQELKKALDKGMMNAKALEDGAFDRMRDDKEFKEIQERLTGSENK
jgi:dienelactone hydrolase